MAVIPKICSKADRSTLLALLKENRDTRETGIVGKPQLHNNESWRHPRSYRSCQWRTYLLAHVHKFLGIVRAVASDTTEGDKKTSIKSYDHADAS
jgi:hypothetical protein